MNLDYIIKNLSLSKDLVLNVYFYGSHLWNYATAKSDFDVIIVLKNTRGTIGKQCVHAANIDAILYDEKTFEEELNNNKFLAVLTQLIPECIIIEKKKFKININKKIFASNVINEIDRDMAFSEKLLSKDKNEHAKKVLIHSLRMACITLNILKSNKIVIPDHYTFVDKTNDELIEELNKIKLNIISL